MDKKKKYILLGLGILSGSIFEILKEKRHKEEIKLLKKKINKLGRCHNEFIMYQGKYNDDNDELLEELNERVSYLEEETTSNYDHIVEVSKDIVRGD